MSFPLPEGCTCQDLGCVLYREKTVCTFSSHRKFWINVYLEMKTSPSSLHYDQWCVIIEQLYHLCFLPPLVLECTKHHRGWETNFLSPTAKAGLGVPVCCSFQLLVGRYCWPAGTRNGCFRTTPPGKWMLSKPERQESLIIRLYHCHHITCSLTQIFSHMEFLFFPPVSPKCF